MKTCYASTSLIWRLMLLLGCGLVACVSRQPVKRPQEGLVSPEPVPLLTRRTEAMLPLAQDLRSAFAAYLQARSQGPTNSDPKVVEIDAVAREVAGSSHQSLASFLESSAIDEASKLGPEPKPPKEQEQKLGLAFGSPEPTVTGLGLGVLVGYAYYKIKSPAEVSIPRSGFTDEFKTWATLRYWLHDSPHYRPYELDHGAAASKEGKSVLVDGKPATLRTQKINDSWSLVYAVDASGESFLIRTRDGAEGSFTRFVVGIDGRKYAVPLRTYQAVSAGSFQKQQANLDLIPFQGQVPRLPSGNEIYGQGFDDYRNYYARFDADYQANVSSYKRNKIMTGVWATLLASGATVLISQFSLADGGKPTDLAAVNELLTKLADIAKQRSRLIIQSGEGS